MAIVACLKFKWFLHPQRAGTMILINWLGRGNLGKTCVCKIYIEDDHMPGESPPHQLQSCSVMWKIKQSKLTIGRSEGSPVTQSSTIIVSTHLPIIIIIIRAGEGDYGDYCHWRGWCEPSLWDLTWEPLWDKVIIELDGWDGMCKNVMTGLTCEEK